ncbi:MAG: hypothetical protein ACAI44_36225 [Candidatus Sericytochromatia bacterium]
MTEQLSFTSRFIRALAVAFALGGMVLSSVVLAEGLHGGRPEVSLGAGAVTLLFVGLYAWGENVLARPLFWLVPAGWLGFNLFVGVGMKGDFLLLALPLVLVLSLLIRGHYRRKDKATLSESQALD